MKLHARASFARLVCFVLLFLLPSLAIAEETKVAAAAGTSTPEVAKATYADLDEATLKRLLTITTKLPKGAKAVKEEKREAAVRAAWAAVEKDGAILWPGADAKEQKVRTTALLLIYSFFESSWQADAQGDCDLKDTPDGKKERVNCRSIGIMQVNRMFVTVDTIPKVLKSAYLGYRTGLRVIHYMIKRCGGKEGKFDIKLAMGGYETGHTCGGAMEDVNYRLGFLDFKL